MIPDPRATPFDALPVTTRRARVSDLPALQVIYNFYSVTTAAIVNTPPSLEARRAQFLESFSASGPHQMWVAMHEDDALGFAWSLPCPGQRDAVLTSIYIAPHATGGGIGTLLYRDLLRGVGPHAAVAWAGICLPNSASVALHRKVGFIPRSTVHDYAWKLGRSWDLGWFSLELARLARRPPVA